MFKKEKTRIANRAWFEGLKWAEQSCQQGNGKDVVEMAWQGFESGHPFDRGVSDYFHHRDSFLTPDPEEIISQIIDRKNGAITTKYSDGSTNISGTWF